MTDAKPLTGLHVLVVEDDYLLAEVLASILREEGADIFGPTPSVAGALRIIEESPHIDFAFLDINLQGESAYPVADALTERSIRYVFATGYDDSMIPNRYAEVARCLKPVHGPLLIDLCMRARNAPPVSGRTP